MVFSRMFNLLSVGLLSLFVTASGFAAAAAEEPEQPRAGASPATYRLKPTTTRHGYLVVDDNDGVFFGSSVEEVYRRASGSTGPLSICELGAGTGEFLKALLRIAEQSTHRPIDYTPVELNQEYHEDIKRVFQEFSANPQSKLQIGNHPTLEAFLSHNEIQYYGIAAFQVLHFVSPRHLPVVLSQIHASLKPDGVFLGSVRGPNPGLFYKPPVAGGRSWASVWYDNIGEAAEGLSKSYEKFPKNMHWPEYFMMGCEPDAWKELLEAVGFKVEICERRTAKNVHQMWAPDDEESFDVVDTGWTFFVASKRGIRNEEKVQGYIKTAQAVQEKAERDLVNKGIPLPSNW